MYLQTRRYLGSAAQLGQRKLRAAQAELAAAQELGQSKLTSAAELGQSKLTALKGALHYEVPDTTLFSLVGTTLNLLNGTTGPGLLALPLAFARCGWLMGTVMLLGVFALNHASLLLLLRACLTTREHSYIGLCSHVADGIASLIDWSSLLFFFGSSVSYLVIIGEAFTVLTSSLGDGSVYDGGPVSDGPLHYSLLALLLLVAFTAVCLTPLSLLRSMDALQCTSAVGMGCLFFTVAVVALTPPPPDAAAAEPLPAATFSAQALLSLPTLTFCFSSQSLFPPALETLHQPATYAYMHRVVDTTMYVTLALHLLVGLVGSLAYGSAVRPNVLDSLPQTSVVLAARLAVVLAFAFTFPMMVFLCRMHLRAILARSELVPRATDALVEHVDAPRERNSDPFRHTAVSLLLVGSSLLCAIVFPNIDAIFGLLGGTTSVVLSFVAPAVFWEACVGYMYNWTHPRRLFCKLLLGFSACIAALSLPSVLVAVLDNLYATASWVPMASTTGTLQKWSGGLELERAVNSSAASSAAEGLMLAGVTLQLGKALRGGVDLKKLGKALKGGIDVDKAFGRRHKQRPPAGGSSASGGGGSGSKARAQPPRQKKP
mmetsp:Transcript_46438/g.150824  ORF Transcript_46438/g.150824 Transcript_46438/m.150824 type:complete len:601 (-) Transcript_46438:49-1851(-)